MCLCHIERVEAIPLRHNGLEDTMSFKLTFTVRIGKWRLTISTSR